MKQQVLELPVMDVTDTPSNGQSANIVLVRLLNEAKQRIAAQRRSVRQTDETEQPSRVSYSYD